MSDQTVRVGAGVGRIALMGLALFVSVCAGCDSHSSPRLVIEDSLTAPSAVSAIERGVIVLEDGRRIVVEGLTSEFASSAGIQATLSHGVEVQGDADRAYCLVEVFNRCGNRPILRQVERVRVSELCRAIRRTIDAGEIASADQAFTNGGLAESIFTRLVYQCGLEWDGKSDVPFP